MIMIEFSIMIGFYTKACNVIVFMSAQYNNFYKVRIELATKTANSARNMQIT